MFPEQCKPYQDNSAQKGAFALVSHGPSETFQIGRVIGESLKNGDCVALTGELGAGKTCLTQGIAKGMGVPDGYAVTSPTFTIVNEYPGRDAPLYHLDLYRLAGSADLREVGYDEYIQGSGVTVIEWAEKVSDEIPDDAMWITISCLNDEERKIEMSGYLKEIDLQGLDLA